MNKSLFPFVFVLFPFVGMKSSKEVNASNAFRDHAIVFMDEDEDSTWFEEDDEGHMEGDEEGDEDEGDDERYTEDDDHAVGELFLPGSHVELLYPGQIADHFVHPASDDIGDDRALNTMGLHQFLMGGRRPGYSVYAFLNDTLFDPSVLRLIAAFSPNTVGLHQFLMGGVRAGYGVYEFLHDTFFDPSLLRIIANMLPVRSSPARININYFRSLRRRRAHVIPAVPVIDLTVRTAPVIDLTMSDDDSEEKTE